MIERQIPRFEHKILQTVDRYFRREDTVVAYAAHAVSPHKGIEYRESPQRDIAEKALATPMAAIAAPTIVVLGAFVKLEDGGPAFFRHERIDRNGPFQLWKLRSMKNGAEKLDAKMNENPTAPEQDPRNTRLGRFMRMYELEELPQLFQVLLGRLRLVGLRAASRRAILRKIAGRPLTYWDWLDTYGGDNSGLFSLNSVFNTSQKKEDPANSYHLDMFYRRNMSLGLDLYIIFRHVLNVTDKLIKAVF